MNVKFYPIGGCINTDCALINLSIQNQAWILSYLLILLPCNQATNIMTNPLLLDEKLDPSVLVIPEIDMQFMNDSETISAIHANSALEQLNVVMMSTSSDPEIVEKVRDTGITDFLSKPVCMEDFKILLRMLDQKYR